eukprot:6198858-Prymnesium_polylepis.1
MMRAVTMPSDVSLSTRPDVKLVVSSAAPGARLFLLVRLAMLCCAAMVLPPNGIEASESCRLRAACSAKFCWARPYAESPCSFLHCLPRTYAAPAGALQDAVGAAGASAKAGSSAPHAPWITLAALSCSSEYNLFAACTLLPAALTRRRAALPRARAWILTTPLWSGPGTLRVSERPDPTTSTTFSTESSSAGTLPAGTSSLAWSGTTSSWVGAGASGALSAGAGARSGSAVGAGASSATGASASTSSLMTPVRTTARPP